MGRMNQDLHGAAPDRSGTVLLILDLISDFEFEDGPAVFRAALPVAKRILKLKQRAKAAGIPGVSSNQCVLFTANDAYVRDFQLSIPRDCISAPTSKDTRFALQYFTSVLAADIRSSTHLRLSKQKPRRG